MKATITLLGDSISAGYGLKGSESLPRRLGVALADLGMDAEVIGAGVSGDTTGAALRRMDRDVPANTTLCVVALGANDLMQLVPPERLRRTLTSIVERLHERGIEALLCGMRAPPWVGAYAADFDAAFAEVAAEQRVPFYPFLLEGVALDPRFNLSDRIHPNAQGIDLIARRLAPFVRDAAKRSA